MRHPCLLVLHADRILIILDLIQVEQSVARAVRLISPIFFTPSRICARRPHRLLDAHLAYLSDRAFVFADYIPRAHAPLPDIIPHTNMRHFLRIPLPALLSGPLAGGPLSARGDDTVLRRAVSEEYFDLVCPKEERVEVGYYEVMGELGIDDKTEGDERMARWARRLREESGMCVMVTGGSVFPWWCISYPSIVSG